MEEAIQALGLSEGCLLPAAEMPEGENRCHWLGKGDWLALAKRVGAHAIFFVGDEPVVVLAETPENSGPEDTKRLFNKIWSMARPQFLFLARPGLLEAYQLTKPPIGAYPDNGTLKSSAPAAGLPMLPGMDSGGSARQGDEPTGENRRLALANAIADVQERFRNFQRDRLESGVVYGDPRFEPGAHRADRALVQDLKEVRRRLIADNLEAKHAHALIARALFLRYLEDREIIGEDYFQTVAKENADWRELLDERPKEKLFEEPELADRRFFRVLRDKEFTYALFDTLARDFNGDILSVADGERAAVTESHLELLRRLLMGDAVESQQRLFFFAYRFDIVPIELISSIYEEFYAMEKGKGNTQGAHYTPPALAEHLLSQVLPEEVLDKRPRVLDPACGSGIFLVESFRRMVRHRVLQQGRRLSQGELRDILARQIAGIELNPEAARIAAFSLSLAWLHYRERRDIEENPMLPNLRWDAKGERDPARHLDILYAGNAFEAIQSTDTRVEEYFGPESADVVVGNPPWGAVNKDDEIGKAAWKVAEKWCDPEKGRFIGDKEQSQAFVHLALALLRNNGVAGMLLSSGVLFKQHENSRKFRQSWLSRCRLGQVINFAHVRDLYFTGKGHASKGIAPFILATFEKGAPQDEHRFAYWSAKHTGMVGKTRAVILASSDMHWLFQDDMRHRDWLWKLYWWGSSRDENLVRTMQRFYSLGEIGKEREGVRVVSGRGYQKGNQALDADWLSEYRSLPPRYTLQRYGNISGRELVDVPDEVESRGVRDAYEGQRLLFKRGIDVKRGGVLVATLTASPFCFRNSIHGFRFQNLSEEDQKVILGIFWSSLARYYFWLTSGSWGMWHDEIHLHMVRGFPIALPTENSELQARIVGIVDELRNVDRDDAKLQLVREDARAKDGKPKRDARIVDLEARLDEAIFDLYVCNGADRDLIRDMCDMGLDSFYNKGKSRAVQPVILPERGKRRGVAADLPKEQASGIEGYLQVFLRIWNPEIEPEGEFVWRLITDGSSSQVLVLLFQVILAGQTPKWDERDQEWKAVLDRLGNSGYYPMDQAGMLYADTFVRMVGKHEILIIKRNEQGHWTRSAALNDADATIAQAMHIQEEHAR
uniref:site-specific DNA-methyltransferase (adenine-specific) n=1 Tax=Candidatus Kentrum sp. TC TaxID=2126339 RepID=A0A450YV33_9GAMM|nr:MAG: N-6 DNA Methylase [Candidatus Kentron sp. TC]